MTDASRSLAAYLDEVAAGTPVPGGGSVTAIVAALAAALGAMVAGLTAGRARYASADSAMREALARLTAVRGEMLAQAELDERAYGAYRAASALPRGNAAEKAVRHSAMQEALVAATEVPLQVARGAVEIAEHLITVANLGNPHVRSDVALGALLAEAALRGALLNIRGNAGMLRDAAAAGAYLEEAQRLEQAGRAAAERAWRAAMEKSTGGEL